MKPSPAHIPVHHLDALHQGRHRNDASSSFFGYNNLAAAEHFPGFQLYSSDGMKSDYGPAKSTFYRCGIVLKGSLTVQLGLERFSARAGSVNFSLPGQVHAKSNVSKNIFGYYLLWAPDFLESIIPATAYGLTFSFLDYAGLQHLSCTPQEIDQLVQLLQKINEEVQGHKPGKIMAVKMYLYLLLLEVQRSYTRQGLQTTIDRQPADVALVTRFHKLVGRHYLEFRQVADYARLLHVTPNHLGRVVKQVTGKTASEAINEMLLQEAKILLRSTALSSSEISYQLNFSEPAAFHHFFRKHTLQTPLAYRRSALPPST